MARVAAANVPRIAFDTEAASFHRYVDRIYLIQMSTEVETVLIDPLTVTELDAVGDLLQNPEIEIVFHDADYDLRVLDRDYGFRVRTLFDTRVAAQLAGEDAVGLGALLEKHLHVRLDKRFQRADWSQRPLPPDMIAYAASDTRYLLRLRRVLAERLRALSRLHWAEEEFGRLEGLRWTGSDNGNHEAFLRIKGAKGLSPRKLAVLENLYAWRDNMARDLDRAPFRVLGNAQMLAIARAAPSTLTALSQIAGMSKGIVRRHGSPILAAVQQAMALAEDALPRTVRKRRPVLDPGYEIRLERLKQLRDACAQQCDLHPGLLCPNGTLQAVARAAPSTPADLATIAELRKWQRQVLGEFAILEATHRA
jgi:ribonuclease D